MDVQFFLDNLKDPVILIPEIFKCHNTFYDQMIYENQYNPKNHKINKIQYRPDKTIRVPYDEDSEKTYAKSIPVTRISLAYQELLTTSATAFLTAGNVSLKSNPKEGPEQNAFDRLLKIWNDEKLDFKNQEIGKALYSETEVAEIWYSKVLPNKKVELKCNIYSPKKGYKLIPVFDANESLIAFARSYKTTSKGLQTDHFDIYTETQIFRYKKEYGTDWVLVPFKSGTEDVPGIDSIEIIYGKIPVIFYQIEKPIWENAQPSIERQEILKSNHADQNDYTGSPILAASGQIKGFSAKGETGKVIELENGADLKYIQATQAPESIKLEMENNNNDIYGMTMQADLSQAAMTKLSGQLSGPIMDRMLIAPHTYAKSMQRGAYGIGIQRRINFLISAICNVYPDCAGGEELQVKPEYDLFRIGGDDDKIALLMKANGNKPILSVEESVHQNPLSDDPATTLKNLETEAEALSAKQPKVI